MIPPRNSATFVWKMEAVLDLYEEPYDPERPTVCFDERPCQLLIGEEVVDPLPAKPGEVARFESHYRRGGTCHVLMTFEPLSGWREAVVTERRRKREFAHSMRRLAEEVYPQAEKIRVVSWTTSRRTLRRPSTKPSRRSRRAAWHGGSSSRLHAGARIVAEHGGDRTLGFGQAVVPQAKVA